MPVSPQDFLYSGTATFFYVLTSGNYEFLVDGAQGGVGAGDGSHGGQGAILDATFALTAGEILKVIVGGSGSNSGSGAGGGGGGSFIMEVDNGTGPITPVILLAAGGGGGGGGFQNGIGGDGQLVLGGGSGNSDGAGVGGILGGGGAGGTYSGGGGGGGGGISGDGANGLGIDPESASGGGASLGGGSTGGSGGGGGSGGFGGGGGGGYGGGGGGGYSGGGGGGYGGGGGGSYFGIGATGQSTSLNADTGLITVFGDTLCYLLGTRVLTPTGEVPVETLKAGDTVVTRWQGIQPVKWIGRQSYDARFVRDNRAQIPVRIKAGALGDRLPARDLWISEGHSMLLDGMLVLASSLINGVSITQDHGPDAVHYFQIDLGTHDCVIAEGAWSETYADCEGLREQFQNVAAFHELHPDHRPPDELSLCAPRPERGAKLEAALRPVVARASNGLKPGPLRGWIDRITGSWKIEGWAQDQKHPELPVLLEVLLEDRPIGTILACDYRADLLGAGIGRGRCSFAFTSPVRILPEMMTALTIRRVADGAEIRMSGGLRNRVEQTPINDGVTRLRLTA